VRVPIYLLTELSVRDAAYAIVRADLLRQREILDEEITRVEREQNMLLQPSED
jgi:hypothetical protein